MRYRTAFFFLGFTVVVVTGLQIVEVVTGGGGGVGVGGVGLPGIVGVASVVVVGGTVVVTGTQTGLGFVVVVTGLGFVVVVTGFFGRLRLTTSDTVACPRTRV